MESFALVVVGEASEFALFHRTGLLDSFAITFLDTIDDRWVFHTIRVAVCFEFDCVSYQGSKFMRVEDSLQFIDGREQFSSDVFHAGATPRLLKKVPWSRLE